MINNFRNGNKLGILILSKSRTQLGLLPVEMGAGNFCIDDGLRQVHWMRKLMELLPSTS